LLREILAKDVKARGGEGRDLTSRIVYLPALASLVAAVLMACAAVLLALSEKAEATFPDKNGRIAYESNGVIYTINPDGSGKTRIPALRVSGEAEPSYSPDGKRIVYLGYDGNDYEIYTIKVGGGDKTRVTNNTSDAASPSYSPDGKRIVYASYGRNDTEIYTIGVGGGGKKKVTEGLQPSYSPDGKRIAYQDYSRNASEIHTIKVGGGGEFRVTKSRGSFEPDYSPDGKRIAYASYEGPDTEIYTISVEGEGKKKVTNNVRDEEDPSYSPNGKKIAYECFKALATDNEKFDPQICTIKAGGGDKTQITDTAGYASDPSWGSRP
jgi:Tol biopolymer transport system component